MAAVATIALLAFIGSAAVSLVLFDSFVRYMYSSRRTEWEKMGRPYGYFWQADESSFFKGCGARDRLCASMMFRLPPWTGEDARARVLALHVRTALIISMAFAVLMCVASLLE